MGRHQQEFVLPLSQDRRPSWDHLGLELGQLGRRPLVKEFSAAYVSLEEEEEGSPGEARLERPCLNKGAATVRSYRWAHRSSIAGAAVAAAAAAAAWNFEFDG